MNITPKCTMSRGCPCGACAAETRVGMVPQSERTERLRERLISELRRMEGARALVAHYQERRR